MIAGKSEAQIMETAANLAKSQGINFEEFKANFAKQLGL
jgi:hypothetical protein